MRDRIFGWSYPPGCSGPPDYDEGPCPNCGLDIDNCICPECPVCEEVGNPDCYPQHYLLNDAQIDGLLKMQEILYQDMILNDMAARAEIEYWKQMEKENPWAD